MFALGERAAKTGEMPEEYVRVVAAVEHTYLAGLPHLPPGEEPPRFAFGPKEIMVISELEPMIGRIAKNEAARIFLESIVHAARRTGDPKAMPTVFMTRCALEHAGAPIEYVSAAEFGISAGSA
jgi:hypothetical protein